jgi:hypothetical protein
MLPGQCPVLAGIGLDLGAARAMHPSSNSFISRAIASNSTCTNNPSIPLRKRRRTTPGVLVRQFSLRPS